MNKSIACPICKKEVPREGEAYPFCSSRCRLIDLGNWLGGKYAIAGEPAEGDPKREDPAKTDD